MVAEKSFAGGEKSVLPLFHLCPSASAVDRIRVPLDILGPGRYLDTEVFLTSGRG